MKPAHSERSAVAGLARSRRRLGAALLLAGLLGGCGFKLRGQRNYAFASIAINPYPASGVALELSRSFGDAVRVLAKDQPLATAQVVLDVIDDVREKVVVGVNASGQVREFQLRMRFRFRLRTPQGKELIAASDITQQRDISFSESQVLAKEAEEALLYRDMQTDIAQQVLRRLASLKPWS